jgi:hypothetical protein
LRGRVIVNYEFGIMWGEVVTTAFQILPQDFLDGLRKSKKNHSRQSTSSLKIEMDSFEYEAGLIDNH